MRGGTWWWETTRKPYQIRRSQPLWAELIMQPLDSPVWTTSALALWLSSLKSPPWGLGTIWMNKWGGLPWMTGRMLLFRAWSKDARAMCDRGKTQGIWSWLRTALSKSSQSFITAKKMILWTQLKANGEHPALWVTHQYHQVALLFQGCLLHQNYNRHHRKQVNHENP